MIYRLMQLDPTWKAVPYLILAGVLISSFPQNFFEYSLFLILGTVLFCRINERAPAYQISLPISGRRIFAARMLSMLAALWAPAGGASIILAFRGSQGLVTAAALLGLTALATLMVVAVQSIRISELEVPAPRLALWMGLLILFPIFWQVTGKRFPSAPVLVACLLASAVLLIRLWKHIPESFQMASRPVASQEPAAAANHAHGAHAHVRGSRALTWRPILRSVYPWQYFLCLPLLFFFLYTGADSPAFLAMFIGMVGLHRRRIGGWLYALPVRRSALLFLFVLPLLLSLAAGYSIGMHRDRWFGERIYVLPSQAWPPTTERTNCKMWNIVPPVEFWKPAQDDKAPMLQAPWGETFQPPISIVQGVRIYNPYAVGPKNSQRFFDWQFAHATLDAYGRSIPRSEYQFPAPPPPPVIHPLRIQIIHIAAIIAWILIGLCYIEIPDWHGFRRPPYLFRKIIWAVPISSYFAVSLLIPHMIIDAARRFDLLLLRVSWALPESIFIVVAAAVPPLALLYLIADKLHRESDS